VVIGVELRRRGIDPRQRLCIGPDCLKARINGSSGRACRWGTHPSAKKRALAVLSQSALSIHLVRDNRPGAVGRSIAHGL